MLTLSSLSRFGASYMSIRGFDVVFNTSVR